MSGSGLLLAVASLVGASGVGLGAFGAHALRSRLLASDTLSTWETAVHYHLLHAVAMLALVACARSFSPALQGALHLSGWLFLVGVILFSGSLYGLALGGPRWLGPVTPLGGLAFILGWLWLLKPAFSSDV